MILSGKKNGKSMRSRWKLLVFFLGISTLGIYLILLKIRMQAFDEITYRFLTPSPRHGSWTYTFYPLMTQHAKNCWEVWYLVKPPNSMVTCFLLHPFAIKWFLSPVQCHPGSIRGLNDSLSF